MPDFDSRGSVGLLGSFRETGNAPGLSEALVVHRRNGGIVWSGRVRSRLVPAFCDSRSFAGTTCPDGDLSAPKRGERRWLIHRHAFSNDCCTPRAELFHLVENAPYQSPGDFQLEDAQAPRV